MVMGRSDYHYKHEPIIYGWIGKNRNWYADRTKVSVLDVDRPNRSEEHPTMKPIDLIIPCIHNSTKADNIIVDLFLGSGSTLIACEQTDRICYGQEISPHYCDVILTRWEQFTGQQAVKING
jgi:DNA modification methylase